MEKNIILPRFMAFFLFATVSLAQSSGSEIFVNQIGYLPGQIKLAAVTAEADSFSLFSIDKQEIVLTEKLTEPKYWKYSDEEIRFADFTEINSAGKYKIIVNGKESFPFIIGADIYSEISKASLKAFYYQRASAELPEKYAGKWARKCGAPDTAVIVHATAAGKGRPEGSKINESGGWFDAGDYNKYTVSAGITIYTLLLSYNLFPGYFAETSTGIPESKDDLPDILNEIVWEIRWLMKMQDPNDGGVYHKTTYENFQPIVMPSEIKAERFVVGKSTSASLNFAAVLSYAVPAFAKYENLLPGFADSCLEMSQRAWLWAVENPEKYFTENPEGFFTGVYGDKDLKDEFMWAGIELFRATKDSSYLRFLDKLGEMVVDSLYWKHVANLGVITVVTDGASFENVSGDFNEMEKIFKRTVENIYNNYEKSPYKISNQVFKWGGNSNLLNQTVMLLTAYEIYGEERYLNAAISNADYVLGRNPLNVCYVTGFGSKSPMNIHHRISAADGVKEPSPGLVVGGPNPNYLRDAGKGNYPSLLPAKCYLDSWESYSTNEVAINWNAPLVFVLSAIDFFTNYNFNK